MDNGNVPLRVSVLYYIYLLLHFRVRSRVMVSNEERSETTRASSGPSYGNSCKISRASFSEFPLT